MDFDFVVFVFATLSLGLSIRGLRNIIGTLGFNITNPT